ncbi:Ribosomal RNA small subunit methyltransferase H [Phycisphaerae bacterium RAS1]|nr:Ribosomal RNA small subunit methyltransferase H [Phycisphaerae bacterium RAS1]
MNETQFEHQPVLVAEVLRHLDPQPGQVVLDGTVGLGGHAAAILPRILPGGRFIGLDLDDLVLASARRRLAEFGGAVELVKANYAEFTEVLKTRGLQRVELLLLDLGVNSAQLADPARGFSFDRDGPLDMRFNQDQKKKAIDLVNGLGERELADLFYEFGQEGLSRKIAKRICHARHSGRITTTLQLARAVEAAVVGEGGARSGKTHPATRVFQALRVAVNDEYDNLKRFLAVAPEHLAPGGRLAVISFHSIEDGLVKRSLRDACAAGLLEELTDRPDVASPRERGTNPRSRSAKLRVARRRPNTKG